MNKSCCLLKCFIELYFLSWLFIKISFLSLCRLFSVMHEHCMQYYKKRKWFWDLLLLEKKYFFIIVKHISLFPGTVHSNTKQFALHLAPLCWAKVRSGWLEEWFWKLNYQDLFESFCSKPICCRASAGSRPYSWSIWDFWSDGWMVGWFHGSMVICDCSGPLQRCAVSGLLSCHACFSLRSNPPFCFALMWDLCRNRSLSDAYCLFKRPKR